IYSVLDNFWLAIEYGDLEDRIDDLLINKKVLPKLLSQFSTKEEFLAHLYYRAFTAPSIPPIKAKLPLLGDCSMHLLSADAERRAKIVAMARKTVMQICEKSFRSIVPFCGVFQCVSEKGNKILREMEPPGHDKWDPDLPSKGEHKATQTELLAFIRDCVKR